MEKPISIIIKETREKMVKVCNESGLSPVMLDSILSNIYTEVHALAEKQTVEEELAYVEYVKAMESQKMAEVESVEVAEDDEIAD